MHIRTHTPVYRYILAYNTLFYLYAQQVSTDLKIRYVKIPL